MSNFARLPAGVTVTGTCAPVYRRNPADSLSFAQESYPVRGYFYIISAPADAVRAEIYKKVINNETLQFLAVLHRNFNASRKALLQARIAQQAVYDAGSLPDFDPKTAFIRNDPTWQGPVPGPGLEDRRVEITGPVDRKMVINALNSGAKTFMADFEGELAPIPVRWRLLIFDRNRAG